MLMILRRPRTITIDLSSVAVGQAFTLQTFAMATAYNRIAGPPKEFGSSATAFLRDPLGIDSTSIAFSGLEPMTWSGTTPRRSCRPTPRVPSGRKGSGTCSRLGPIHVGEPNLTPVVRVRARGKRGRRRGHDHRQPRSAGRPRLRTGHRLGCLRRWRGPPLAWRSPLFDWSVARLDPRSR